MSTPRNPITHVVVADTDEFGTVACGYSGTPNDIARAVMAKACGQGYSGTYQARMAELGWRVEPVFLAPPVPGIDRSSLNAATSWLIEAAQAARQCIAELKPTQARAEVAQMLDAAILAALQATSHGAEVSK